MIQSLCLLLITSSLVTAATNPKQCYFPNGQAEPDGVPCNVTAAFAGQATPCCFRGDNCHESGVCSNPVQGLVYRLSCTDSNYGPGCGQQLCMEKELLHSGRWIQTCDMAAHTACCMTTQKPCCNDSSIAKITFTPGKLKFALDRDGVNLLGQAVDGKGVVLFDNSPTTQTGDSPTPSSTSCAPTVPPALADAKQCEGAGADMRNALLGVGISLGVLLAAAIAAAVLKWTAERKKGAGVSGPPEYYADKREWRGEVAVPGTHEMFAGQSHLVEAPGR